jgi:hypothetical protein
MKEMVLQFKDELSKQAGRDIEEEVQLYMGVEEVLRKDFDRVDLEAVFSVIDGIAGGLTPKELGYLATFFVRRARDQALFDPPSPEIQNAARRLLGKFEGFVKRVCWVKPEMMKEIMATYINLFPAVKNTFGGYPEQFTYDGTTYNLDSNWQMFTTNYDNVLEVFFRGGAAQFSPNVSLNTGFDYDPRSQSQIMNPKRFLQSNGLRLVKLHGSVTWWVEEGTWAVVEKEQPPSPAYLPRRYGEQVMLYPIQQKDTFVPPYLDMFYALDDALRQSKRWLVIGYSFADDILRAMFARSSKPDTVMVLVHTDDSVAKKVQEEPGWKGQIRPVRTKFGESETISRISQLLR